MPKKPRYTLDKFRAYLTRQAGVSAATAETYVKCVRAALAHLCANISELTAETVSSAKVRAYDQSLSAKARENFRAAWRHYVRFVPSTGTTIVWGEAPTRRAPESPRPVIQPPQAPPVPAAATQPIPVAPALPATAAADQAGGRAETVSAAPASAPA